MTKPGFGEPNLAAVTDAIFGAVGGLFAVKKTYAILTRDLHALSTSRTLALIGFLVKTPIVWIVGGQIGPRLEGRLCERVAGIIGGIAGRLLPVGGFVYRGWRMAVG